MSISSSRFFRQHLRSGSDLTAPSPGTSTSDVRLDTNDNPFGSPLTKWYNRRNDESLQMVKDAIGAIKAVDASQLVVCNGMDDALDLLIRSCCEPQLDSIIICAPANTRLEQLATFNNVQVKYAPLLPDFQLDLIHLEQLADKSAKLLYIASPNGITGNAMNRGDIELVLNNFHGLVMLDETFINFSRQKTFATSISDYPNMVVLQNFDVAWGLAALHCATIMADASFAQPLEAFQTTQLNQPTSDILLKALQEPGMVNDMIKELVQMRAALKPILERFPFVEKVFPSEASFLLVKVKDAAQVHGFLQTQQIAVKDVSNQPQCDNCLRISVGTEEENTQLITALIRYYDERVKPQP